MMIIALSFMLPQANVVDIGRAILPVSTAVRHVNVLQIDRQRIMLPIRDASGRHVLYRLTCGSGLDDEHPEDLSGLIMCKLISSDPMQNPRDLLLLERSTQGRSWETRGRFLAKEVTGRCGTTPQWGRSRIFYVGAMRIELNIRDVETRPDGQIVRYSFTATIRNRANGASAPALSPQPAWFGTIGPCPI